MTNVLHMFLGNTKGGRTQYMINTWENIDHERFHFDFLTLCDSLDYEEDLEATGCKVFHISCYAEENPTQFKDELMNVLKNGYDAIHVHFSFWRGFLIEECAKEAGIPKIILHSHNNGISMVATETEAKALEETHFRLRDTINSSIATHFLACSNVAAEWMYADKIPQGNIQIVRNGIALERFIYNVEKRKSKRHELSVDDKYVMGCIAKFNYQKNHDFLIDAYYRVTKQYDNCVLLLVGVGELQTDIEAKVKNLEIDDKVVFLGKRNDVPDLLQAMDLFLLPSRFDGFPLSIIEAQAAGLPCVVGNVPVESCLSDRAHRLGFDAEEWAKVMLKESEMASRAFVDDAIMKQYDIKEQVSTLEKIYLS